jgi:hypothetical protein
VVQIAGHAPRGNPTVNTPRETGADHAQDILTSQPTAAGAVVGSATPRVSHLPGDRDRNQASARTCLEVAGASAANVPERREPEAAVEQVTRYFTDALRAGEPHTAALVIHQALKAGHSPVRIQSQVIAAAMRTVGDLCERGELTIADEHLASVISHKILALLRPALLAKARPARERSRSLG